MRKILPAALLTLCAFCLCHAQTPPCAQQHPIIGDGLMPKSDGSTGIIGWSVTSDLTISNDISNGQSCTVTVESTDFKDGKLIIVKRSMCVPFAVPAVYCPSCDYTLRKVWKEIYVAHGGEIVLERKIEGTLVPAQGERVEWPKQ